MPPIKNPPAREPAKSSVGEILKKAEQLMKSGHIDEAVREVIRAKEADPANKYIRAYEERLAYLKEEHEKHAASELTRRETEEAARVRDEEYQKRLGQERKRPESKPIDILLIEDEEAMRSLIGELLTENGYTVTAVSMSDEALVLLTKWKPRLILCDIVLKTSTMGGFLFYEKVREMENLQDVPFVFLTGLTGENDVNKGKELGVDDYLIKPISEKHLIATVKGKLKRFEKLRQTK